MGLYKMERAYISIHKFNVREFELCSAPIALGHGTLPAMSLSNLLNDP